MSPMLPTLHGIEQHNPCDGPLDRTCGREGWSEKVDRRPDVPPDLLREVCDDFGPRVFRRTLHEVVTTHVDLSLILMPNEARS